MLLDIFKCDLNLNLHFESWTEKLETEYENL